MATVIRDEAVEDRPAIRAIVETAFGRSDEADLVDRLRDDGDAVIALVATQGGALVGHVLLSRMTAPFPALGLAPLAVAPARQHQGIGTMLVQAAIDRARRAGWEAVFVLGNPAYYRRFGFDAGRAAGFASPYAGPNFMVAALQGELPDTCGPVSYAPAFAALT